MREEAVREGDKRALVDQPSSQLIAPSFGAMKVIGAPVFFKLIGGPSQVWPMTTPFDMKPDFVLSAESQNCLIQGLRAIASLRRTS